MWWAFASVANEPSAHSTLARSKSDDYSHITPARSEVPGLEHALEVTEALPEGRGLAQCTLVLLASAR